MKQRYNPDRHRRRSVRLRGWDYAGSGVYFVTVCTSRHQCLLGHVVDGRMQLNPVGRVVDSTWRANLTGRDSVGLDVLQVMPNHVHAIIVMSGTAATATSLTGRDGTVRSGSLGALVGNLKAVTTRRVNKMRHTPGASLWQRNYWDHVVRDDEELGRIRAYIVSNPAQWSEDRLNLSDGVEPTID